jgi:hypothetical protein
MNERIENLALHAGFNLHNDVIDGHDFKHEIEKFAELIIKECVCEFVRKTPVSVNVSNRARHVFKHFGVEE